MSFFLINKAHQKKDKKLFDLQWTFFQVACLSPIHREILMGPEGTPFASKIVCSFKLSLQKIFRPCFRWHFLSKISFSFQHNSKLITVCILYGDYHMRDYRSAQFSSHSDQLFLKWFFNFSNFKHKNASNVKYKFCLKRSDEEYCAAF